MPRKKEPERPDTWTCPFCQQTFRVDEHGPRPPDDFGDRCRLPEHIVNGGCIVFRDQRKARDLLLDMD
jgi:hypothetical protein